MIINPELCLNGARLIAELLCNAGWLDDADELLIDIINDKEYGGVEIAKTKAIEVDELINDINQVLPQEEQLGQRTVDTFYKIIKVDK
ncbi:MAG: hypothetical protein ACXW0J_03180 [Nitrososphaeraceae archaeon]